MFRRCPSSCPQPILEVNLSLSTMSFLAVTIISCEIQLERRKSRIASPDFEKKSEIQRNYYSGCDNIHFGFTSNVFPADLHFFLCTMSWPVFSLNLSLSQFPAHLWTSRNHTQMTTNHRPTLESKRGRANAIKDTIQHARSQNSQGSLKLRPDVESTRIDSARAKRALDELHPAKKLKVNGEESRKADEDVAAEEENKGVSLETLNTEKEGKSEKVGESGQGSGSNSNSDADADSDSESGSDLGSESEAELLAELAKIKKEKEEKRKLALAGNPLIDSEGNDTQPKKSWRAQNRFGKKTEIAKTFTTNSLESDVHRQFLTKYFR